MKKILVVVFVGFLIATAFSAIPMMTRAKKIDGEYVQGEIIVKLKDNVDMKNAEKILSRFGNIKHMYKAGFHKIKVNGNMAEMLAALRNNPIVEYAEPNYIAKAFMVPNDPYYSYQWHFHGSDEGGIDMEPTWDITTGNDVIIAEIDTGIRIGSDLQNTKFTQGYDFVNDDDDPTDDNGHGTHVAGTLAQSTNNNEGVAGVAFGATLMPVKVLDYRGYGTYDDIVDGIYYAVDHGANIISMSLGGSSGSQALEDAVAYAYNHGVTVIAAAGNDGHEGISYPAAYDDYVIAVGATQYDKTRAPYSNYGSSLDVVAPGGNTDVDQNGDGYGDGILQQTFETTWWGGIQWGYYFYQGTSMATPHVSGVAALIYSLGVTSPDDIRSILESTAIDLGDPGWDKYYGYGLINAYAAVKEAQNWGGGGGGENQPPVADAGDDKTGDEGEEITFDASGSYDPDGSIVSYEWDFGDGSTATGKVVTHKYADNGVYTVTLTVKDNDGATSTDTCTATINNVPPVADAGGPYSGSVGEEITFDASGSYDAGTADTLTYEWDFGDGSTASGKVVTHAYSQAGNYTVTLTVKDDDGGSDTDTTYATITEQPSQPKMHVESIEMDVQYAWWGLIVRAYATVTIYDANGNPVEGATVSGHWSGLTSDSDSGTTDSNGKVTLYSDWIWTTSGTFTFTVDNVEKDGYIYDSSANKETSDSISI